VSGQARIDCRNWRWVVAAAILGTLATGSSVSAQEDVAGDIAGQLQDPIVGLWVGKAAQPENDPFDVRLTFVSPKGGVSRYPSEPTCGGMLVGDRNGDGYEYQETVTYGGSDERTDGCLNGTMKLSVDGDTMKYDWASNYNGQDFSSSGELKRQSRRQR
jgi:hypothetical protein